MPSLLDKDDDDKDSGPEFCIDAGSTGNVARFINHSCQPNLFVQCVLSVHHDITQARVILFAADNIPPLKVFFSSLLAHICVVVIIIIIIIFVTNYNFIIISLSPLRIELFLACIKFEFELGL